MSGGHARDSRYRAVGEVLRTDAAGRELVVTDLRRPPARTGVHEHTVEQGDRLDHLGQRYYRRPHRWWEICDANPGVLAPLALVGRDPVRTVRLTTSGGGPPGRRAAILTELRAVPGVERAGFDQAGVLVVDFNELSVTVARLAAVVAAHGDPPVAGLSSAPVGGRIVVPPPGGLS